MMLQQNKNSLFSKIFLTCLWMSMVFIQTSHVAHAQNFTCEGLSDPKVTNGWIITILEEQIGTPSKTDAGNVINCFRVDTLSSDKATYTTTYKSKCGEKTPPDVICKPVQVYFAQSGAELLYTYVGRIYKWAATTIGIVAVLLIVFGGIVMSTAQGDSGRIEKAKERIMQSIGGLVILFLSALILYTINPNFFTLG